jgi:hypothetical protein
VGSCQVLWWVWVPTTLIRVCASLLLLLFFLLKLKTAHILTIFPEGEEDADQASPPLPVPSPAPAPVPVPAPSPVAPSAAAAAAGPAPPAAAAAAGPAPAAAAAAASEPDLTELASRLPAEQKPLAAYLHGMFDRMASFVEDQLYSFFIFLTNISISSSFKPPVEVSEQVGPPLSTEDSILLGRIGMFLFVCFLLIILKIENTGTLRVILSSLSARGVEKWSRVMYRGPFYNKGIKYVIFQFFSNIFVGKLPRSRRIR